MDFSVYTWDVWFQSMNQRDLQKLGEAWLRALDWLTPGTYEFAVMRWNIDQLVEHLRERMTIRKRVSR